MKIINRKAYYDYIVLEEYVAGIALESSEVKSLRIGNANMLDSFCYVWNNEIFIKNVHISKHSESSYMNHDEMRDRKLLLRKKEINEITKETKDAGITLVPLEIFTSRGRFKVKIAVVKGKKTWNKKESLKERDIKRENNKNNIYY